MFIASHYEFYDRWQNLWNLFAINQNFCGKWKGKI